MKIVTELDFLVLSIHGIVIDFVGTKGMGGLRLLWHCSLSTPISNKSRYNADEAQDSSRASNRSCFFKGRRYLSNAFYVIFIPLPPEAHISFLFEKREIDSREPQDQAEYGKRSFLEIKKKRSTKMGTGKTTLTRKIFVDHNKIILEWKRRNRTTCKNPSHRTKKKERTKERKRERWTEWGEKE